MEKFISGAPLPLVMLLLIVGFVFLIKGADFFVEGSSNVARKFKIPSVIIGMTIVAMGTSLPETSVSVTASITNNNALAVSNAIGSNIFNMMIVIGVCAIITPVAVGSETIKTDIPFSALCALLLVLLGWSAIGDVSGMVVGHLDGILLLIVFAGYLVWLTKRARKNRAESDEVDSEKELLSIPVCIVYIVLGAAGIALGGDLTVDAASRIAIDFGMSQTLVGLTIVSIGTSLPELVTSVVAARKKEVGMALGNAIGSNIFNILMVLGIASAISPINFIQENVIDIIILLVFTLIVWGFASSKKILTRLEGIHMVLLYAAYAVYICIR
ncbi:MAG: calcium/sodium antiporter [Eubacteriales bacterium]|nr:calcium/sodium antiporter [Eubacteriales bacterium]